MRQGLRQSTGFPAVLSAAVLLGCSTLAMRPASADEALKQRFLAEAPAAWRSCREAEWSVQGDRTSKEHDVTNNVVETTRADFKFCGPWALFMVHTSNDTIAYGTNSRYAFRLKRFGESEWLIEEVVPHGDDPRGELSAYAQAGARGCVTAGHAVRPRSLSSYVEEATFQVQSTRELRRGNDQLIEVIFTYQRKNEQDVRIRKGTLLLDPQRHWFLREAELEIDWPSDETGTVVSTAQHDDSLSPIPVVKKRQSRSRAIPAGPKAKKMGITGPTDFRVESEYDVREYPNPSEKDFTLSAFGLPEPGLRSETGRGWLWVLLAGLVLVLIALALRRRLRSTG